MKNFLKRWALPILVCIALAIGIIWVCKPNKPVNPVADNTFIENVMKDYAYAKSFESDTLEVRFYEVQTVLNGNLNTLAAEDVKILSSMTVFSVYDTVYFLTRTYGVDTLVVEKKPGIWMGSSNLNLDTLKINLTFEDAVKKLYENGKLPTGDKMTFRNPISTETYDPYYIFGVQEDTVLVAINSNTGIVEEW